MTASPRPTSTGSDGSVVFRRLVARAIDDGILVGLSVGLVAVVTRAAGDHAFSLDTADDSSLSSSLGGHHPLLALATGLLATAIFVAYTAFASLLEGRSPGRAAARLRIVAADGSQASFATIFGRELIRVALMVVALAVLVPAVGAIQSPVSAIAGTRHSSELLLIANVLSLMLPLAVVIAAWTGLALVDPDGRTPQDRLSRTRVVAQDR